MTEASKQIREQLLAQNEPTRERRVRYEQETQKMLETLDVRLKQEKWGTGILWGFVTLFVTAALLIAGFRNYLAAEGQMLAFGLVLMIFGSVEIVKYFINRSRVQILKELKSLESQIVDLKEQISNRSTIGK